MDHVMMDVEEWNPLYLQGITFAARDYMNEIRSRGFNYGNKDIKRFLNEIEAAKARKALDYVSNGHNFPKKFGEFVDLIRLSNIDGEIVAVIPLDYTHFVCITTDNSYGVEMHSSPNGRNVHMSVYCPAIRAVVNTEFEYEVQWEYAVINDQEEGRYYLEILHADKDTFDSNCNMHVHSIYADDKVEIKRCVNDKLTMKMEVWLKNDLRNKANIIDSVETIFLRQNFTDAEYAYSVFCSELISHKISLTKIKEIHISIYDIFSDEDKVISLVHYENGERKVIQFDDSDGTWWITKTDWRFSDSNMTINSARGLITINIDISLPDSDDVNEDIHQLPFIASDFILPDYISGIVDKLKNTYYPKYFPKIKK